MEATKVTVVDAVIPAEEKKEETKKEEATTDEATQTEEIPDVPMPKTIYCLGCREQRRVKDCKVQVMTFESAKNHVPGKRLAFRGTCATCGRQVSRFAANPNKKEKEKKPRTESTENPAKKQKNN